MCLRVMLSVLITLATQVWYLSLELPVANANAGALLGEHVRSLCRGDHALVGTSLTSAHR